VASYKTAFGSLLKQEDLQGREVRAVVDHVSMEEIKTDDGKERKLVAHFAGKDKGLVLNRTTCEALEAMTGTDDVDYWAGTPVILYVDPTVKFGTKVVGGIRLKAPGARPAPPTQAPSPPPLRENAAPVSDDDIPF
jgi:hypothetical protein